MGGRASVKGTSMRSFPCGDDELNVLNPSPWGCLWCKGGCEHERKVSCSFLQGGQSPGSSPSQPPQNRAPDRKMKPTQEGLLF